MNDIRQELARMQHYLDQFDLESNDADWENF